MKLLYCKLLFYNTLKINHSLKNITTKACCSKKQKSTIIYTFTLQYAICYSCLKILRAIFTSTRVTLLYFIYGDMVKAAALTKYPSHSCPTDTNYCLHSKYLDWYFILSCYWQIIVLKHSRNEAFASSMYKKLFVTIFKNYFQDVICQNSMLYNLTKLQLCFSYKHPPYYCLTEKTFYFESKYFDLFIGSLNENCCPN